MMVRSRWLPRAALAGAILLPLLLRAQASPMADDATQRSVPLAGMVRDSTGTPVPAVELRLIGTTSALARTDEQGGFHIAAVPVGTSTLSLRRLGFAPVSIDLHLRPDRTDSLVIVMVMVPATLDEIAVMEERDARSKRFLASFWERRKHGFGHYLTREEIAERDADNFVDLVRRFPGVRITNDNGHPAIRFGRNVGPRDCPPQYYVDGMRIERGSPDEFSPTDVEAIEIYSGISNLPVEFSPRIDTHTCGAVVIWTRLPG